MEKEAVKVIVRCRPLNQREKDLNSKVVVTMTGGQYVSIVNPHDNSAPPKTFCFDGAYYMDSTTEQIYSDIAYPLVEGVIEGYNGTVFAYGQTGCGKSFSMQGVSDPSCQKGIIPRAFEHIFEAIATSEDAKYLVHASYLEIYNEEIRDLLGKDCKKKLELKEHPEKGAYIPGLSLHAVHDVRECERIMEQGWRNRSVGSTLMNADSSRSHSIFTVSMEMMKTNDSDSECIRSGKLNLVDLAGSERQAKTGATGDRLKEATKINLSLSALGNVISALVDGKCKHIPYRDSKLTRLLQDSLGGNTKTLMVACLSPADNNYDESLSTLRYANRAKNIQNKPKINEDPKDALLRQYQEEIKQLKSMLEGKTPPVPQSMQLLENYKLDEEEEKGEQPLSSLPSENDSSLIDEEKQRIKTEYEQMMQELRQKYDEEQKSNAKLQEDVERLRQHYEEEMQRLNNQTNGNLKSSGTVTTATAEAMTDNHVEATESSENRSPMNIDDALKRLQELEEQMVGGEKVHDKELKEKRLKKKKAAEKRLHALAEALHQVDEDDKAMLQVYDSIQEELKAKTELLKKEKQRANRAHKRESIFSSQALNAPGKVRALEREIKDLQSEFEFDRMDYLETIRRQDQQVRLLQQILDKIQPCLRRDCNYSNLDKVKAESTWDEDQQRWRLPDLVIIKTKLPPAGVQPGGRIATQSAHALNGLYQASECSEDKFLQKLERGEQEDIAGKYFRPKRAKELLLKAQEEAQRLSQLRINNNNNNNSLYSGALPRDGTSGSSSANGSYFISTASGSPLLNGNGGSLSGPTSPDTSMRKPMRLEALPIGDMSRKNKRKKNGFAALSLA